MLKKPLLCLLFLCFTLKLSAFRYTFKTDSLLTFIKSGDQDERERKLTTFIKRYFLYGSLDSLAGKKEEITRLISRSGIANGEALMSFTEGVYQKRLYHLPEARGAMLKAIEIATKTDDHYLLYTFISNLAFIQTDQGNAIGAISSYRLAKKEAVNLNDPGLQILINYNISDIYYKYNFFNQASSYLRQAEALLAKYRPNDERLKWLIYIAKSDIFFKLNMPDSLAKCNEVLKQLKSQSPETYTQIKRNEYYLSLLHGDLGGAIKQINAVKTDTSYLYTNVDRQFLADAFYKAGKTDSTTNIVSKLLADPMETNHPEIKYHQYEVLGEISKNKSQYEQANAYFKAALQQAEDNNKRLTQVGNVLSQIKIDELEGAYLQTNEIYQRERIGLTFAVVVAILVIVIGTMFYRHVKQKRHYEKLFFNSQKEELAFINSHEVRRHLSNILGIVDLLKHSDDKVTEYNETEKHLFESAESLDKAIKSFSDKLKD